MEAVPVSDRDLHVASLVALAIDKRRKKQPSFSLSASALDAIQGLCWSQMAREDVTWEELRPVLRTLIDGAIELYACGLAENDARLVNLVLSILSPEGTNTKIDQIKAYRQATGVGLKEAKEHVEGLRQSQRPKVLLLVEFDEDLMPGPFREVELRKLGVSSELLYLSNEVDLLRQNGERRVFKSRTRCTRLIE